MSEKPYTYTDPTTGARLAVDDKDIVIEVRDEGVYVSCPTGDDAVALVRAILAVAGDTGHAVVSGEEIDEYLVTGRQIGARSMRDRVTEEIQRTWPWMSDSRPPSEKCAGVVAAVRALPLLPDTEPAPDQSAWPVDGDDLGCGPMCHCGGPASANPTNPDQVGPEEGFDAGWKAGVHRARAEHERRLTSLEKDYRDLAALVHGHGEDIGQAQAAIRGVGGAATSEDWVEFGKQLRRQDMGEDT